MALSPGSAGQLGFPAQTHQTFTSSCLLVLTLSSFSLQVVKKNKPKNHHQQKNPTKQEPQHPSTVPTMSQERQMTLGRLSAAQSLAGMLAWEWLICHSPSSHLQLSQENKHKLEKCSLGELPATTPFPRKSDSSKSNWFSPSCKQEK